MLMSFSRDVRVVLRSLVFAPALVCCSMHSHRAEAQSAGTLGNGLSAAAAARGGSMVAEQGSPLEAVEGNPAGLAGIVGRTLEVSGIAVFAGGSFKNSVDPGGSLRTFAGAMPYGAFGMPIGHSRFKVAGAITPEFLMRVAWQYNDPAGTANVSCGSQKNESQFIAVRASSALAFAPSPKWAFGASLGLVYNQNLLHAPYIFQQQPQLQGLKVLLDLHTNGLGWNGSAGAQWHPTPRIRLGASWKSPTFIPSRGYANGSASALFAALGVTADPSYRYQAEVDNNLPQSLAIGARWQANHRAIISLEGGWTNWGDAFKKLPVKLRNGSNAVINIVAGSAGIEDQVPLYWHDQGSFRSGLELPLRQWTARAGYSYQSNPVPSSTITPLTAAILRNSVSTGLGWQPESSGKRRPFDLNSWGYDIAYQAQLPSSQSVGQSSLQAGEYSNSRVRVMTQSITVSAKYRF